MIQRYFTKSLFSTALDCSAKLFYINKKEQYADENIEDPFLAALAEGGFQVGELAKYLFSEDPVKDQITIASKNYDTAIESTNEKLFGTDPSVVAEAAFRYNDLFVRVDIAERKGKVINIYEVKSKSWNSEKDFWKSNKQGDVWIDKDWLPYLCDVAFQKYVVQHALPEFEVHAHMIFADADMPATINGLNQLFRMQKGEGYSSVKVKDGTTRSFLGNIPLAILPVDTECDWIYKNHVEVDIEGDYKFEQLINLFSGAWQKDERIWSSIGRKCKDCQFTNKYEHSKLKSGFTECWQHWAMLNDDELKMPLVLELWGGLAGAKSLVDDAIKNKKFLISRLEDKDYWPENYKEKESGLHPADRRKLQIMKCQKADKTFYLDRVEVKKIFENYEPPYHFIDFETSMIALPFHMGRKPYEAIAFQYSYHLMDEKGKILHKNQYLSLSQEFPNYDFVRALKNDLLEQEGTIFRYHNHENTYLNFIKDQLLAEPAGLIKDRDELIDFIEDITHHKGSKWRGPNDMQDLWKLVLSYYYSPFAKGSNSIKEILPAVINDSAFIRDKYSKPIYGTANIPSKNFKDHVWITDATGRNPYKTLPGVLPGYENAAMDEFVPAVDEIKDGGAAMMAYAYLQFTDVPPEQKSLIGNALYRYCELDTMAMVMIWEFWGNEIGLFK